MKQQFSTSWLGSKQVRKQRKYRHNAPLHLRHSFLSAHLPKELRKRYGKRSIPIRKGDEVLIMRGNFAKKQGKIIVVDLKKGRVTVEDINRTKKDGTKVNVYLNPSNLQIISLNLEDSKRLKKHRNDTEDKRSSVPSTSKSSPTLAKREEVAGEKKDIEKPKEEKSASDKNANK